VSADPVSITTARLLLRPWRASDLEPFARMNADPRVMEWFPQTLNAHESAAMAAAIGLRMSAQGWGLWAVEVPGVAEFIGLIGLNRADDALGYPAVEVGWRLAAEHWGCGYAPEGARASLAHGFDTLALEEIVSFTAVGNAKSRRVMEKIGMTHDPDEDFDHPRIPEGSALVRHVLYRISRSALEQARAASGD
jgi:3-dehydroquinate dehydratase/shikimate dehydrogenase